MYEFSCAHNVVYSRSLAIAEHNLNPREIKGLAQLAFYQARPMVDYYFDKADMFTDVVVQVNFRDSFVPGTKGSDANIEIRGCNNLEARQNAVRKSVRCSVKVTYIWNKKCRTVQFDECI